MPATYDPRPVGVFDSGLGGLTAVRELFHICFWLARTYGKADKPADASSTARWTRPRVQRGRLWITG